MSLTHGQPYFREVELFLTYSGCLQSRSWVKKGWASLLAYCSNRGSRAGQST